MSVSLLETIVPGQTSREEVLQRYGKPDDEYIQEGVHYLVYPAGESAYETVGVRDDRAIFVAANPPQEGQAPQAYAPDLGEPELVYYSKYAAGARTLAYPGRGMTFVVTSENVVVEIHHYVPMTPEEYHATLGAILPTSDPFSGDN